MADNLVPVEAPKHEVAFVWKRLVLGTIKHHKINKPNPCLKASYVVAAYVAQSEKPDLY